MPSSSRKRSRDRGHSRRRSRSRSSKSRSSSRAHKRSSKSHHHSSSHDTRTRRKSRTPSSKNKHEHHKESKSKPTELVKEVQTAAPSTTLTTTPAATGPAVAMETNGKTVTDISLLTHECEEIIKQRRERVEQWRKLQKEKGMKEAAVELKNKPTVPENNSGRKWNLEDDDDEDENANNNGTGEEEEDPLEEYMKQLNKEFGSENTTVSQKGRAQIIKTVVKKKPKGEQGEIMEDNIDAMEYSTEEEEETLESISVIAKKDKLPVIDHDKIYYQKVQKNFYIEVDELKRMTPGETAKYRNSLGGIKVKGKDCPKPIKTWAHCGVSAKIMNVLKMHKFLQPTPIQCQAIPAIMSGRDVIGVAKTGSGKTMAYLIPLLRHVKAQPPVQSGEGPISIIMSPTRELACQIYREVLKLTNGKDIRCVCIYGGTVISEQIAKLKCGAEILVCTPGRMIDMMAVNGGRVTNMRRCTFLVLDEADRMFDMGFEPQVLTILGHIRPERQTVMFSATFPRKMEALARKVLINPIEIEVGGKSIVCQDVSQNALILDESEKFNKLLELLGLYQEGGKVIVFVEKQENADKLLPLLIERGYICAAVHGGIDQDDRDSFIANFKTGRNPLLIATSVAARGLDVTDLNLVVNYDCPNHYEDYVHRCGRTGRAGNKGMAYTFITPDQEKYIGDVIKAFKLSGTTPPDDLVAAYAVFKDRMKQEGKKVFSCSGFKGKGFQFDEAESQLASEKRKFERDTFGLGDSDEEVNLDDKIIDMFAVKKNITSVDRNSIVKPTISTVPLSSGGPVGAAGTAAAVANDLASQMINKRLEAARQQAMKIDVQRKLGQVTKDQTQVTAQAVFSGTAIMHNGNRLVNANPVSGKDLAAQKAEEIHNKLGYMKAENNDDEQKDGLNMVRKYEEELEINDFASNVRYRLTSKETMTNLSEYYDVGVSVRGLYMPSHLKTKMEQNGERPLYLSLESVSEIKIQAAKKEIIRIIKEELLKLQKVGHTVVQGRYKVV